MKSETLEAEAATVAQQQVAEQLLALCRVQRKAHTCRPNRRGPCPTGLNPVTTADGDGLPSTQREADV